METAIPIQALSFEAFMDLQEEGAGFEYERGRLIPLAPVDWDQGSSWTDITIALGHYVKQNRLGRVVQDTITYLDPEGSVRYFPDIVYLANEDLHRKQGRRIVGPPTLVVEVTPPHSDARDTVEKKASYHAAGVPWYWIANNRRQRFEEYRYEPEGYVLVSETAYTQPFRPALFPGLEILIEPSP